MKPRGIAIVALALIVGTFASTTGANAAEPTTTAGWSAQSKPCPEIRDHPELSWGDSGNAVRHAQCLIHRGFSSSISVDGEFGPETYEYVRKVQATCRIDVDGIIGPDTWRCLHSKN